MNATRDAAGLPTTPTSRANSDINSITESLRTEFNLPVKPRDATWSPTRNERSEADQCQSNINFLYFKNSIELSRVLQDFRKDARRQKLDGKPAIKLLLDCLKDPVYLAKNAPSNKIDEKFRAVKNIPRAVPKYPSIDGATDHGPVSFDPIPAPKLLRKKSPKAATSSTRLCKASAAQQGKTEIGRIATVFLETALPRESITFHLEQLKQPSPQECVFG
ncbi:hypothetical protein H2203_001912 [Taxawa tesnikishii (nom. ined.)]|nr:hypothetical protein H2203_001912 [Dothideales sp. JES 119]